MGAFEWTHDKKKAVDIKSETSAMCRKPKVLRQPGIEPGSNAWEASMITITLQALNTPGGDRTRDPRLIRPVLCL